MTEIWKDAVGYEGIYQVSSMGRVKSLHRVLKKKRRNFTVSEKILKPFLSHHGYHKVTMCKEKLVSRPFVHCLVARAFLGNRSGLQVNHINGQKLDNRLENLEYVTNRENCTHYTGRGALTGVRKTRSKKPSWEAQIQINKKIIWLGVFETQELAAQAYRNKLQESGLENKYAR